MNIVEITVRTKDEATSQLKATEKVAKDSGAASGKGFQDGFSRQMGGGLLAGLFGKGGSSTVSDAQRQGQNIGMGLGRGILQKFNSTLGSGLLSGLFGTSGGGKLFGNAGNTVVQDATKQGQNIAQGLGKGLNDGFADTQNKVSGVLSGLFTSSGSTESDAEQHGSDIGKSFTRGLSEGFAKAGSSVSSILGGLFGGQGSGPDESAGEQAGKDTGDGFLRGFANALSGGKGSVGGSIAGLLTGGGSGGKNGGEGVLGALDAGGVAGGALPGVAGVSGKSATLLGLGGSLLGALPAFTAVMASISVASAGIKVAMAGAKQLIGSKNTKADPNAQGPLYNQAQAAKTALQNALTGAASGMLAPLKQAFGQIPGLIKQIEPGLKAVFAGSASLLAPLETGVASIAKAALPELGQAFKAVAPLLAPLLAGLGQLLKGVLPALVVLLKAAAPAVDVFAKLLGGLGKDIGGMFSSFAPVLKASSTIMGALGTVINAIFPIIGKLAATLATALAPAFGLFAKAIAAVLPGLTPLLSVLGEFAGAVVTDLAGVLGSVATLIVGISPSFKVLAVAMAGVFNVLENSGVFAILGDALENIVPSLAQVINLAVKQLVPFLPQLINLVSQFANILITLLSDGLTLVLTGLTAILKAFPQLIPILAGALVVWKSLAAAQLALNLAMDVNPFVAIGTAIVLLVGIVVKYHKQILDTIENTWHTITSFLGKVFDALPAPLQTALKAYAAMWVATWNAMLDAAKVAWALISGSLKAAWDAISGIAKATWDAISGVLKAVWDVIAGSFKVTLDLLTGNWSGAMNAIKNTGVQVWNAIKGALEGVWNALSGAASGVWNAMKGSASAAWNAMKSTAVSVWNAIKSALSAVWNGMKSAAEGVWNAIKSDASGLWGDLKSGFNTVVSAISTAWGKLSNVWKAPVNFLINTVYMGGIRRLWDDVMNAIGLGSLDLPSVSGLSTGGRIPGYGGGDQHLVRLESGEAVIDKDRTQKYAPLLGAMGVPGFASGGIVGDAIDVAKMVTAAATGNSVAFANALSGIIPHGGGAGGELASMMATLPVSLIKHIVSGLWHKITTAAVKSQTPSGGTGTGGNSGGPGGGSEAANAALAKKLYPKWSSGAYWTAWNNVAMRESGWNNLAHNPGGAFGIAQALGHGVAGGGGTYGNQYGGYGLSLAGDRAANNGQPNAQIQWMANYMSSTYGGPIGAWQSEVNRGFYANGGATSAGWAMVGERGRELIKVPGGANVYPAGASAQMVAGGAGAPVVVQLVASGGQSDFDDFMTTWLKKYVRVKGGGNVQAAFGANGR